MLNQRKEYSRYYGGFRGVDFATDDTLVSDARFPYAVNVYKDYVSGAGQGIETIPGFRKRFTAPNGGKIYGIHSFKSTLGVEKVLVHAGSILYDWASFGKDEANESGSAEMDFTATAIHTDMGSRTSTSFIFNNRLYILDGKNYLEYDGETLSNVKDDAYIPTTYINIIPAGDNKDNGTEYEQRNMLSPYFKHTFIPVTYKDEEENEVVSKVFVMNEQNLDAIVSVKVYGTELATDTYTVDLGKGEITLNEAPGKPEDNGFPEFYAGVEITAKKAVYEAKDVKIKRADGSETTLSAYRGDTANNFVSMIESATIATTFDNRVFFSGIPGKPNLVLYCGRNTTGYSDPSYIGILNYVEDGVGTTPITAMLGVAGTLLVLKNDTQQDGSVYYHTPTETGENILPKIYPSTAGLAGTGCLGAALNFLDDPVFISERGLEAVSQLKFASERSIVHRSSLVDAKLLNTLALECASLCEYGGYLVLLCEGKIFLADSRQLYQNSVGSMEYEWYFLDEIGVYKGQYEAHFYLDHLPQSLMGEDGSRKNFTVSYRGKEYAVGVVEDIPEADRIPISSALEIIATEYEEKEYSVAIVELDSGDIAALLCDTVGEMTGGVFSPATIAKTIGDNLYFGTHSGDVCSFNFDKRNKTDGTIAPSWYTFNKRAIYSGVALKNDNCGMPGMVKSTVKRSLVAKVKNFAALAAKISVKTNKKSMSGVGNISANRGIESFFGDMDFANFSFIQDADSIFTIREKEKKWVEKQYFIYTDTYMKPFALFYATFKYTVIGKYKG
jgi:hypothetical protein